MDKKLITIIIGIFLVATITAGVTLVALSKDVTLDKEIKDSLEAHGIGKFEVLNQTCIEYDSETFECIEIDNSLLGYSQPVVSSCKVKNEFKCVSHIYQEGGINKDIEIITKYCLNWVEIEEEIVCEEWKTLTDQEVILEVEDKVKDILTNIANINIERDKPKVEEYIGEEYKVDIKE